MKFKYHWHNWPFEITQIGGKIWTVWLGRYLIGIIWESEIEL